MSEKQYAVAPVNWSTVSTKTPVSEKALVGRINRKLAHEGEQLRTARTDRDWRNLGRYYCVNVSHNCVTSTHHNLAELGRLVGALGDGETLVGAQR